MENELAIIDVDAFEKFLGLNKLYIFSDLPNSKEYKDEYIIPRNGDGDYLTILLFQNNVVSIYKASIWENNNIYTAVDGSGAILWADEEYVNLVKYVHQNTACIDLDEYVQLLSNNY